MGTLSEWEIRTHTFVYIAFMEEDPTLIELLVLDAMVYASTALNWTPRSKFEFRRNPASCLKLNPLDFHKTLVLPFGISAVAHQKNRQSKLHGHGSEAIFIGPSENSLHRSGVFLNIECRETIVRRSFNVWNDKPFYDFLLSDDGNPVVEFQENEETSESNSDVPDLINDPDSDDSDSEDDLEIDTTEYVWSAVNVKSLSRAKRKLVQKLTSENYLEYDESSNPPSVQFIWTVDCLSRRLDCDALYVRYWDASLPRPRDPTSFEYTLLSKFLSWAKPESFRSEGAISVADGIGSEGDPRSEGGVME